VPIGPRHFFFFSVSFMRQVDETRFFLFTSEKEKKKIGSPLFFF